MSKSASEHQHSTSEHRCPRCGELQVRGFRYFRKGIGYCDPCAFLPVPWIIGPGFYQGSGGVVVTETW